MTETKIAKQESLLASIVEAGGVKYWLDLSPRLRTYKALYALWLDGRIDMRVTDTVAEGRVGVTARIKS